MAKMLKNSRKSHTDIHAHCNTTNIDIQTTQVKGKRGGPSVLLVQNSIEWRLGRLNDLRVACWCET